MDATTGYARAAIEAAENINTKTSAAIQVGAVRAVTYALLDLAQAIREHGR